MPIPSVDAPAGSPASWLHDMAATIHDNILLHGAVLIHGICMHTPADVAEARQALAIEAFTPTEAFVRRNDFGDGVVSPIQWPDERLLCHFQEGSFSMDSPSFVLAACVKPPSSGGEAHLADTRLIPEHLPVELVDKARKHGWTMTRVFHMGFGITWQEAFSVTSRAELEDLLAREGIDHQWRSDSLHTVRSLPALVDHPVTGKECWFNDLAFLNAASMTPHERTVLTAAFGDDLPMDTAFGDGTPLSAEDVSTIQRAYEQVTSSISWQPGDVLVVDNIMTSLGRAPFDGTPEFLIALGSKRSGSSAQR
ncbi:alpha-ketoglutarate-dependent taurine dioxygenase [Catenulispora sp. GAS73]|uniref:TauD/TfdA family dioxygenase n=1 Tax=Catenulispora sp. GAS73 TaxID=3156269 RepID=UPI00351441E9